MLEFLKWFIALNAHQRELVEFSWLFMCGVIAVAIDYVLMNIKKRKTN